MASKKLLTLILVRNVAGNILLGFKKRGFGEGKWQGFGGKVEPGETIPQGAARELTEECGLQAHSLTKVGILDFEFVNDPVIMEVHVFATSEYSGKIIETEEMLPKWYQLEEMPLHQMWPDYSTWFQWYLNESTFQFKGHFLYQDHQTILRGHMEPTDSPPVITTFNNVNKD